MGWLAGRSPDGLLPEGRRGEEEEEEEPLRRGGAVSEEAPLDKGPPRTGFQVLLEGAGVTIVGQSNRGDKFPRFMLCSMGRLTCIVCCEPLGYVVGEPNVVLSRMGETFEEVNPLHLVARLRQGFGGQPSPPRVAGLPAEAPAAFPRKDGGAKAGGGRGARTPDLLDAIQALSQLSYAPTPGPAFGWHGEL